MKSFLSSDTMIFCSVIIQIIQGKMMIKSDNLQGFLPIAHCPSRKVSLCAVSAEHIEIHDALSRMGIEVFPIEASEKLSRPVASHADLRLGMLSSEQIAVGKGEKLLQKKLEELGFHVVECKNSLSNSYPQEALLDFLALNNRIIGKRTILEKEYMLKFSQFIHINQGYAKCNLAVVNEHSLITSDLSAAKACREAGFDVLLISPGAIELPGYDSGFIGGCCGLIAPDILAFSGQLDTHPDGDAIKAFLQKHNVSVMELCKGKLKDIGGIIPLKQVIE